MGERAGGTLRRGQDRILAGVCSGIAEYFQIDPFFVRLVFLFLTFLPPGIGFFLYLGLWFLMPPSSEPAPPRPQFGNRFNSMRDDLRRLGDEVRTGIWSGFRRASSTPPGASPPTDASASQPPSQPPPPAPYHGSWWGGGHEGRPGGGIWFGIVLIVLGAYLLVVNLGLLSWLRFEIVWPVLLIFAGILLLVRRYT